MRTLSVVSTLAACALLTSVASAGVMIQSVTKPSGGSGKPVKSKMLMEGQNLVVDFNQQTMIFHGAKQELLIIDHGTKQYMLIDKPTVQRLTQRLNAMVPQMKAAMAHLPPEQRRKLEKQMPALVGKKTKPTPTKVKKTSKSKKVKGHKCTVYEVYRGKELIATACVAAYASLGLAANATRALKSLGRFSRSLAEASPLMANVKAGLTDEVFNVDGVPLEGKSYEDGKVTAVTTIIKINKTKVAASKFKQPSGYKQQTMELPSMGAPPKH